MKQKLYVEKFFYKSKRDFPFKEIRKFICVNGEKDWELNYSPKMDDISVPSCFVSARLRSVFGENWNSYQKQVIRTNKNGIKETKIYTIEDIWHILFEFEDEEYFTEFLSKVLEFDDSQINELSILFNSFPVGYANQSLKAINNILPFLHEGIIYSESVILAKIPEIIGKNIFEDNKNELLNVIQERVAHVRNQKNIISIVNNLIFKYYTLDFDERFGWKDFEYKLSESDLNDVENTVIEFFGQKTWNNKDISEKQTIISKVSNLYQSFFASEKREHLAQPHLVNSIKEFLLENFVVNEKTVNKIYHPSQIDIYPRKEGQQYLLSPKTAAFKNPMAYKTLYRLKDTINCLIEREIIDNETRIVVEIARELNDSNKRWAIEKYQRDREAENIEYANAISELLKDSEFSGIADPNSNSDTDKFRLWLEQTEKPEDTLKEIQNINKNKSLTVNQKDIQKYRLWKEQNCICLYTGKIINLTDLFDNNKVDFEHTIPRSKSFDNSLANLTVCYADYNRNIKNNKMPSELPNYYEEWNGYSAIKPKLESWEKKVDDLFKQIDFWKFKSKTAMDKSAKDDAIRQKHLRQMQYDYWKNKVERFKQTEITQGFINSQLTDTQIITKYAFHYLKTVFNKVDVIKGSNTADFRKIYGINSKEIEKKRGVHSHHAIDAAVLTLIPSAKKREETLKKAYFYAENNHGKQYLEQPFKGFNYSMIEEIQRNILINNIADKDQTLTPVRKIVRKRGRIVWIDKENRIPKKAQGDSIRGELHLQTYYGKIKIAAKDENGSLIRDKNNDIIYNLVDGKDEVWMVIRKPIDNVNFSSDIVVDQYLYNFLKKQLESGIKQVDLVDFQGRKLRHLRCRVKAARGFMNPDNVTVVKEQVYKSKKDYKNYIYTDSGENYLFGLYVNEFGKQIVSINKFEAALQANNFINKYDLFKIKEPVIFRGAEANLYHIFEVGQKVLFYEIIEELKELDKFEISNRLYYVKKLFDSKTQRIIFQHHLEARNNEELLRDFPKEQFGTKGKDGFSRYSIDFIAPRLLLTPSNFNFIIEGKDFEMELDGSIKFKY